MAAQSSDWKFLCRISPNLRLAHVMQYPLSPGQGAFPDCGALQVRSIHHRDG